jgi:DNA-3-methyladenine glycosylase I
MIKYHDQEWGVPEINDRKLFEFLILEGAQAGLSWNTVLNKRENYRKAFDQFDPDKIARYRGIKIKSLLANAGIIRNKLKIAASVNNAQRFLEVREEFGSFAKYMWRFVDGKPVINKFRHISELPAFTKVSDAMSKDLKQRGFKFVGSTICYAHMQAVGMVNDHLVVCYRYREINKNIGKVI